MSFASFVSAITSLLAGLFLSFTAPAQTPAPVPTQQITPAESSQPTAFTPSSRASTSRSTTTSSTRSASASRVKPDTPVATTTQSNLNKPAAPPLTKTAIDTPVIIPTSSPPSPSSAISSFAPVPGAAEGEPYKLNVATYVGGRYLSTPSESITDQSLIQKLYAELYALPALPKGAICSQKWDQETSMNTELIFYFDDPAVNFVDARYWSPGGCEVLIHPGRGFTFIQASLGSFDTEVNRVLGL
jgi:hypothetical protein